MADRSPLTSSTLFLIRNGQMDMRALDQERERKNGLSLTQRSQNPHRVPLTPSRCCPRTPIPQCKTRQKGKRGSILVSQTDTHMQSRSCVFWLSLHSRWATRNLPVKPRERLGMHAFNCGCTLYNVEAHVAPSWDNPNCPRHYQIPTPRRRAIPMWEPLTYGGVKYRF